MGDVGKMCDLIASTRYMNLNINKGARVFNAKYRINEEQ